MAKIDPDLDGFPVLRIDQIPLIKTDLLERANLEVLDLVENLKTEGGNSQKALVQYLYRQMNEMEKEVAKRAAEDRVMAMLCGAESALQKTEFPRPERENGALPIDFQPQVHTPEKRNISSSKSDQSSERRRPTPELPAAPAALRIPLPSELRRRNQSSMPSQSQTSAVEEASVISSTSAGEGYSGNPRSPGASSEISTNAARPPRRPRSGQPTRRSMIALEQNFGSEFVVGATERKKRFYPKKEVKESEEQRRARARESRRQIAMKRLLERKETRQQQKEAHKRKRLHMMSEQCKAKVEADTTDSAISRADTTAEEQEQESSESESVSGGEDDLVAAVEVPECVRRNIKLEVEKMERFDEGSVLLLSAQDDMLEEREFARDECDMSAEGTESGRSSAVCGMSDATSSVVSISETSKDGVSDALLPHALTGAAQVKNMAALTKLRKLKEQKKAASTSNDDPAPCPSQLSSPPKQTSLNTEESTTSELRTAGQRLLETSQSSPLLRSASTELEADACTPAKSRAEQKLKFEDKLREALGEISLSTKLNLPSLGQETRSDCDRPSSSHLAAAHACCPLTAENGRSSSSAWKDIFAGNSLIEESQSSDGSFVYLCRLGPDDLPGLKAWTLVSIKGSAAGELKWMVNLQQYFYLKSMSHVAHDTTGEVPDNNMRSRLTLQRSKARRVTSYGLILLAKICESLMTGDAIEADNDASQPNMVTEDMFRALWKERLSVFDNLVADHESQEGLFRDVTVCGNMYAVCKKLENLLRTSFVAGTSGSKSQPGINLAVAGNTTPPAATTLATSICDTSTAPSPPVVDIKQSVVDSKAMDSSSDDDDPIDPNCCAAVFTNHAYSASTSRDSAKPSATYLTETKDSARAEGEPPQETAGTTNPAVSAEKKSAQEALMAAVHGSSSSIEVSTPKKKPGRREPKPSVSEIDADSGSDGSAVKISDVFKNIVEIFPAVQLLLRQMKTGYKQGDHDKIAITLIECMTTQLKLYEEWMEVMDDYATVFCHDKSRGVPSQMDQVVDGANALVYSGGTRALHYRVQSSRPEVANIVTDVFNNLMSGWEELPQGLGLGTSWNVLWSWAKPRINMKHLIVFQKINHFQDSKQLTRKDLLKKNLGRLTDIMGSKSAHHFEIMPKTFLLPNEYTSFVREYTAIEASKNDPATQDPLSIRNIWIMKPVGLSRGRGISLVQDITSLTYSQTSVLQKYVDRPLCLGGYKFDLRLYILVTSFQPLEAFIYNDGFARISTEKYRVDSESLSNQFIHLTNSSIQKNSATGPTIDNPLMQGDATESNGSKIGLQGNTGLWQRLRSEGINVEHVWSDICMLVVKSLVAVDDKIDYQPCCFELFGYDVLLDADLRPWLIEVNASPSLARATQLDVRVKNSLIRDIMQLIDPPPFDRMALTKVMRKRLKDIQQKTFSMGTGDPMLERDLRMILGDHIPRRYGEEPKQMGDFERLCPNTKIYSQCVKLKSKLVKSLN